MELSILNYREIRRLNFGKIMICVLSYLIKSDKTENIWHSLFGYAIWFYLTQPPDWRFFWCLARGNHFSAKRQLSMDVVRNIVLASAAALVNLPVREAHPKLSVMVA